MAVASPVGIDVLTVIIKGDPGMFHFFTPRLTNDPSGAIGAARSMASRFVLVVCYLVVTGFVLLGQPATAQGQAAQGEAAQQIVGPVTERQALQIARSRFPGNVISINEVRQNGRVRFRIRMDNEGNIFTVYIDKATGVVIEG